MKTIFYFLLLFIACSKAPEGTTPEPGEVDIFIEAEHFIENEGITIVEDLGEGGTTVSLAGEGFLEYDLHIPFTGRYRIEIHAIPEDTIPGIYWVEDVAGKSDKINRDISGSLRCAPSDSLTPFTELIVDGSPLAKGIHKVRLHFSGGKTSLDWWRLTLLEKHRPASNVLRQSASGNDRELVWSDEFDNNGYPDTSNWTYGVGNWGWRNHEHQYYTKQRIENARIKDGFLIIEARPNDSLGWTSARLNTRGKTAFLFGKIEIRAKVPVGNFALVKVSLIGNDYVDEHSWPDCGQMHLLEINGQDLDTMNHHGKIHSTLFRKSEQGTIDTVSQVISVGDGLADQFHVYSFIWEENKLSCFLDGESLYAFERIGNEPWPFNEPQNLILELAIVDPENLPRNSRLVMENQQFEVDYVRVYGSR